MQNVDRGITGSSLAGSAILHEIGAEYGIIEILQSSPVVDAATASRSCGIKESVIQLKYPRSGGLVARTSKWMGEKSFYPQPENSIVAMAPGKIVDLGSGSGI